MPDPIDKSVDDVQPDKPDTDDSENSEVEDENKGKMDVPDSSSESDEDESSDDNDDKSDDASSKPDVADFDAMGAVTSFPAFKKLPKDQQELVKKGFLLQGDYTKKTQEIANIRKQAEAYQKARPILDRVFADEDLLQSILSPGGQPDKTGTDKKPNAIEYSDDPKEYADQIVEQTMGKTKELLDQQDSRRNELEAHKADLSLAEKVDERLNSDKSFSSLVAGVVNNNPLYQTQRMSAVEATKEAIKQVDNYLKSAVTKGKQDLIDKAKGKKVALNKRSTGGSNVESGKINSMRDAHKAAEAEKNS